jgi:glutathione synthase/RimK-type ligase-like ATP-grasp enzyme
MAKHDKEQSRLGRARSTIQYLSSNTRVAKRDTGKSLASQLFEIARLRLGAGKLAADEYFQYQLYDDRRYSWNDKREFFGRFMEDDLVRVFKTRKWVGLANDKILSYAVFEGLGFPTPRPFAVYHAFRTYGSRPVLRSPQELASFLRSDMPYPFLAKPVFGMWGRDVLAVESIDRETDTLHLASGRQMPVNGLAERYPNGLRDGVLFQELLRPHPDIRKLCGPRICSVRIVTVIHREAPRILATVWKIATGGSMADNYWEPGNMIAVIDPDTGCIGRPFTGLGREIRHIDDHPDTGERLTNVTLPDWRATVDLCLTATASLPGIKMQAWDIALTDKGPTFLEVNVNGGMRLPQLVAGRGLYHGYFRELLKRHRYPARLSVAWALAFGRGSGDQATGRKP